MELLRFISAISFTIILMFHFEICVGEDMKTTLLGSDLYDLNLLKTKAMRYRLLSDMNETLFIGGQDVLMTILINKWNSTKHDHDVEVPFGECEPANDIACSRQKDEEACFNYIRVFNVMDDTKIFVCGSNALYPRCYYLNYNISDNQFQISKEESSFECNAWQKSDNNGVDFTPFNWDSEMVNLFSKNGTEMFTGGSRKVEKRDSVICHIFFADGYPSTRICTAIGSEFLNKASYVGKPIQRNGHTYFFYREIAEEYSNHGKIIYSRVGRICNNDTGGTYDSLDGKLISFIKARLDCSISGDYDPFFFNELKDIYQSTEDSEVVYAVFTTPKLGLQQSAVCRFDLNIIEQMMNEEMFRGQYGVNNHNNLWLPVTNLVHRPGICANPIPKEGYEQYWDVNLIDPFVVNMRQVKNVPTPMFILQNANYTSIVVEDRLTDKKVYILGTDNSTVFMAYLDEKGQEKIFHKIDLKESHEEPDEVTDLSLHYYNDNTTFVYGTSNRRVFGFQLANCARYTQIPCSSNPYCKWSEDKLQCLSVLEQQDSTEKSSNDENISYEDFTSKAVCENDTVVLKFAKNSPVTCLKEVDQKCRFYLTAYVKNSNPGVSLNWQITPNNNNTNVTMRNLTGTLFKHIYYEIDVTVKESTNYTFQFVSSLCSLTFQVSLDETDEIGCKSFCEDVKDFDDDVEKYRYCLYRWPQDHAVKCQSRITRQEKRGITYFPRSMEGPCNYAKSK